MSAAHNLKSVVTIGGAVDSSFKGMTSELDKQLGGATRKVKTLEREQKSLTKQIKKAKLAGEDVSQLTRRYSELGGEIDGATRSARGLQAASDLRGAIENGASYAATTSLAVAGLSATVFGLTTATNAATAEQNGLAKSYGMSIEQFNAWGGVAAQAGLSAENTGDLVEELSNKFGEFKALGAQSSVSDVFGKLGIDKAMLNGLSAAEQFEFVMHKLEKVTDVQQASSLADMLMGGEGAKVVTYLKNSGQSLDGLLKSQKGINNLTQEGADGASKYNSALKSVTTAMYSAWQDVAGVVGGEVAPVFDDLAVTVSTFVKENKTEIVEFLKGAVNGAIAFAGGVWELGGAVNSVVQTFGGWETVLAVVSGILAGKMVIGIAGVISNVRTMITTIGAIRPVMLGVNAIMAANPIGAVALAVGLLVAAGVALYQNWDKVKAWFEPFFGWFEKKWESFLSLGKKAKEMLSSVASKLGFGGDGDSDESKPKRLSSYSDQESNLMYSPYQANNDKTSPTAPNPYNYASRAQAANEKTVSAASGGNTVHQTVEKIEIVAAPGQSPKELGQAVADTLSDHQNAMFDLSMSE